MPAERSGAARRDEVAALLEAAASAPLATPFYLVDEAVLERNLAIVAALRRRSGARVLLALKAFALPALFPLLAGRLDGAAASSLDEARLAREGFGDRVHLCAPAYPDDDLEELLALCSHVVFNSLGQWRRARRRVAASPRPVACALRVNPEHSEVEVPLYDPCQPGSRLGVRRADLDPGALDGISGLHFHTLCGADSRALERTLAALEARFAELLARVAWVNLGGGHHLTRPDYDLEHLGALIEGLRERHALEAVYLEPGEALVLDAGVLVASVLDVLPGGVAVLDASATAHAPDVLEMPYRPDVAGAGAPGELGHDYRLGGPTCLAGDYFGAYSFREPLEVGSRVVFEDMACYTFVKSTTFNGVRLPAIAVRRRDRRIEVVRRFDYRDYRERLAAREDDH